MKVDSSDDHMGNFFDAVRTRTDPVSPVEAGHLSATVGHLIVIARRTGLTRRWDSARERFTGPGADEAAGHIARPMRKPYGYGFVG